ncbi:hypothetical protein SAMN05421863_10996 [Nitrosomonas communis]|uniref:Uncharacterized protein n=1 Tax=Nitrosomonas communis TaxID=44574 RepID=A0A1I4W530_9PROT|nr:hypothetical protein SAMN05421863_10996 [Nitrosomonas communis]
MIYTKDEKVSGSKMLPFEQGGLDSLCGIYSIVNIGNGILLESRPQI